MRFKSSFFVKVFNSILDFACKRQTVVTLGTFDGVHLGHQKIINRILNSSKNEGTIVSYILLRLEEERQAIVSMIKTLIKPLTIIRYENSVG